MALITLPPEVLTIIIRKLDTRSLFSLYETCKYIRDLIQTPGVVQGCQFSMNTLATVRSFNLTLFKDISGHLKALFLSGVNDLLQTYLLPALENMKNLRNLDVSFTKVTIPDYLLIIKVVPTLKSLAINFSFPGNHRIDKKSLLTYQQAFEGLKNVHFVGRSKYLVDTKLAVCILQKADLSELKLTLCWHSSIDCGNLEVDDWDNAVTLQMAQLQIYYIEQFVSINVYTLIDTNKYEVIVIVFKSCFDYNVIATPLLQEFICEHFSINVGSWTHSAPIFGQAALMFWEKERTQFNREFYSKLMCIIKEYIHFRVPFDKRTPVPENYKLYSISHYSIDPLDYDSFDEIPSPLPKRARQSPASTLATNYNKAFKEKKDKFKLRILLSGKPVSLRNCDFLKKLSHVTLFGEICYTPTFFKNLFACCDSLVTLEIKRRRGIVAKPLTFLPRSKSIKNLLLYIVGSHLEPIFECLCQCTTLENIHLMNTSSSSYGDLPDPTDLFTKCDRLYNFCYQTRMYNIDTAAELSYYKDIKCELGKHALNIDMFSYFDDDRRDYHYSPYISVFDVFRYKPI